MTDSNDFHGLELAIVGMSGRFPGADDVDAFWQNLVDEVDWMTDLSDEEMIEEGADPETLKAPTYVKKARRLAHHDHFDAAFFGISPREAEIIDPQQRIFLECAWAALEDAGYDTARFRGMVGVFAGSRLNGYFRNVYSNPAVLQSVGDLEIQVANDKDYLATRVSYKLDLGGPSVTVQTACSTALVAIHHASQALLNGECSMALAGGVGLRVPETGYVYVPGEVLSPDGRVRAFSKDAGGTMFSSGGGVLVLRRLEDALRDGDRIRAVVKGSAVTNDGAAKVGFTAPGMDGQVRVLRSAMIASEVEPETISYVEAHGTGTQLGDPIEVSALTKLFRESTDKKHFCALGSVKTNIGHMGAASGVASMVKTVMALENEAIPASLHFTEPNPQIDFDDSPFVVNTKLRPWQTNGMPRRAGVSAFGMGGTNAHVVLEEAPPPPAVTPSRDWQLLVLSARTPSALDSQTANLTQHLAAHPDIALADVAHTLQVGRRGFEHRRVAVVRDRDDALAVLGGEHPERLLSAYLSTPERPVTFMFSGQGAQYAGMTGGLYRNERVFRETVDRCCELLAEHLDVDLRTLLVLAEDADETAYKAAGERLRQTAITQPALFAVEYAVAQQLMAWGIQPESMIGHSIGEYVAACLAGVFSLEDALALVAARGQLMQKLPSGAMLSVALDEAQARAAIADQTDGQDLAVAAINAPGRVVIAGPHAVIEALRVRLTDAGTACQVLLTSHAFHSPMMEPILAPFAERVGAIALSPPKIPFVSNVTGTWIRRQEATDPAYWARHLRSAVRFADGLATLADEAHRCLVEIGPGKTLSMLARQQPDRDADQPILQTVRHPKAEQNDQAFLLGTFGQAWLAGAVADLRPLWADEKRRRLSLPTYPFERQRFWVKQGNLGQAWATTAQTAKTDIADWFYVPFWKPSVAPDGKLDSEHQATWLLFQDTCGVGQALAAHLRTRGQRVIQVDAGSAFADRGEGNYTIAPGKREDYTALIAALASNDQRPDHIAHLFSITAPPVPGAPEVPAVDREPEATERGFWSLLFLAQALGTQKRGTQKRERTMSMAVVSNNLHAIAGESFLCPEKATLLGPAKILPQEYPHLRTTQVDVVLATDPDAQVAIGAEGDAPVDHQMVDQRRVDPRTIERLVGELLVPSTDAMVAYRGDQRWVRGYDAVRIEKTPMEQLRIRSGGSYLITGGLGGIGLSFAEALARDYGTRDHRVKLALLTLSPLPPRDSWLQYLEQRGADRLGRRIQKVMDLEASGAEVLVVSADVADADQLRAAVEETVAAFGSIHGVLHAAGLAGGGMIQLKAPAAAARVLAPKVQGTLNLAAALDGIDLDFLALCSSTIAVVGGFGQVDYCAANSFLDAYAHAQQRAGKPVISINWGAWQDVGMAVDSGLMRGASDETEGETEGEAEGKGRGKPIHPLIDRCVSETAELTVYATDFSPQRHWVLAEHRIMGTPAIPGTTYLEMARAAYAHHGAGFSQHAGLGGVELRDVYFLGPLMIAEGTQREAKILLEPDGDGFSFRITSTGDSGAMGEAPGQAAHARGKVGPLAEDDPADEHRVEIDAIRRRCDREHIEIEGEIMATDEGVVRWGPRWQSLKVVHLGTDEALAEIELPDAFIDELDTFVLHPALLDVATGLVGFMEEGNHLPLSYQRVRIRGALGGTLFSHVTKVPPVGGGAAGGGKETVSVNVSLLDADGVEQVRIDRFTMKKVGDAADSLRRSARGVEEPGQTSRDVAPMPDGAVPDSGAVSDNGAVPGRAEAPAQRPRSPVQARGGGIKPEDGIEALLRTLSKGVRFPQVAISAKDLNALFAEVNAIDRDAIGDQTAAAGPRATHARPNLPTPFRAPESDTEKQVAEVWQATLGIDEVGVDDNFFDLGGDSIIGIQLISRLSDLGFELSPEQLFEHQTITELARQLDADASAASPTEDAPPGASEGASAATAEDSQSEAAFSDAGLAEDDLAAVLARFEDA